MKRLCLLLAAALTTAGCGNWVGDDDVNIEGAIGAGVDASGRPVAVVVGCGATFDQIEVVAARTPEMPAQETNKRLVQLRAISAQSGVFTVSLSGSSGPWTATGRLDAKAGETYLFSAYEMKEKVQAQDATVAANALKSLRPGQVISGEDGAVSTQEEFTSKACEK